MPVEELSVERYPSLEEVVNALSCGKLVSTGMIVLFRKESFTVCSGWGEVMC